jgi:hypothetical protein
MEVREFKKMVERWVTDFRVRTTMRYKDSALGKAIVESG